MTPQDVMREGIPGAMYGVVKLPSHQSMEKVVNRQEIPFNSPSFPSKSPYKNNLGVSAQQANTSGAGLLLGSAGISLNDPQYKQLRKIYVGGLPDGTTEHELVEFFSQKFRAIGLDFSKPGFAQPANSQELLNLSSTAVMGSSQFTDDNVTQIFLHKGYAFVDFRTPQEATFCVNNLDGVHFRSSVLKIKRPKDYVDPHLTLCETYNKENGGKTNASALSVMKIGDVLVEVMPSKNGFLLDSPNKLFVGNLPKELTLKQICGYLVKKNQPRCVLKSLHVPKIFETNSQFGNDGFIFCEFYGNNEQMVSELNKISQKKLIEDMKALNLISTDDLNRLQNVINPDLFLIAQRAPCDAKIELTESDHLADMQQEYRQLLDSDPKKATVGRLLDFNAKVDVTLQQIGVAPSKPTSTVAFLNCLNLPDDLRDQIQEIKKDFRNQCSMFGKVANIIIPTNQDKSDNLLYGENYGKILVQFSDIPSAENAQKNLSGKLYRGRTIITSFV